MPEHWFFKPGQNGFREALLAIFATASRDVCRQDARDTLGDEHDQCQYLFTKAYTLMQERQDQLSDLLLACSRIPHPVVELRYYRSRPKGSRERTPPQFVEKATGADFAFVLDVDLASSFQAARSVLGQAKIVENSTCFIDPKQLATLLDTGGPESAAYSFWGPHCPPLVVTAANVEAWIRRQPGGRGTDALFPLGMSLGEFYIDVFLGLWFGRDYTPAKYDENPPPTSVAVLYHFLHATIPPPNIVYLGVFSGGFAPTAAGLYVNGVTDI